MRAGAIHKVHKLPLATSYVPNQGLIRNKHDESYTHHDQL